MAQEYIHYIAQRDASILLRQSTLLRSSFAVLWHAGTKALPIRQPLPVYTLSKGARAQDATVPVSAGVKPTLNDGARLSESLKNKGACAAPSSLRPTLSAQWSNGWHLLVVHGRQSARCSLVARNTPGDSSPWLRAISESGGTFPHFPFLERGWPLGGLVRLSTSCLPDS